MSKITGVPRTNSTVRATYGLVKQQLPTVAGIDAFLSSHQIGIAQLGSSYCSALVEDNTMRSSFFPGLDLNVSSLATTTERNAVIDPLLSRAVGSGLVSQPVSTDVRSELNNLMDRLCTGGSCTAGSTRVKVVVKAVCTAALASAVTTVQ